MIKKYKILCSLLSVIIIVSFVINCSCSYSSSTINLTENITKSVSTTGKNADYKFKSSTTEFALKLFGKNTYGDESNCVISPMSAYTALSMVANGADNKTLIQFEKTLGIDIDDLNDYMYKYIQNNFSDNVKLANSIWIKDDLNVQKNFINKNVSYYNSQIFQSKFNDSTKDDINKWVSEKTGGVIDEMIDEINKDAAMYLFNAVAFDEKWETPYASTFDGKFTNNSGKTSDVDYLKGSEYQYLKDENSVGFIKSYEDNYSFVALLPDNSISINDYINSLDYSKYTNLINSAKAVEVETQMPTFDFDYSTTLNLALSSIGIKDAFDYSADFSKITGENDLFISKVLQKSFISVNKEGTKAGSASSIEVYPKIAISKKTERVILNRPFVFAIIDNNSIPLFLGSVVEL